MKTIEKAAHEFFRRAQLRLENSGSEAGFIAGVEFAQRWVPISDGEPKYYDSCLVKFENGEILLVWRSWSESIGGDIYTICGTNIIADSNPVKWKPINIE